MDLIGFRFKNFQRGRCTDAGIGITLAEQVDSIFIAGPKARSGIGDHLTRKQLEQK